MAEAPEALEVTLRKLRALAPPFHRHIARSKLMGKVCQPGDRAVIYEVVSTVPDGPVQVTEKTVLHFE
jgi:hypothetical protein